MSNIKRPRPAVPVLVHVDNPSGGDSAEITEEVKSLSNSVGTLSDSAQRRSLVAMTSDMRKALDDSTEAVENIHSNIGTTTDFSTDTTVIGLLKNIKENMAGGGGGSGGGVDMTTVNTNTTQINNVLGNVSEESTSGTINGRLQRNNELAERTATNVLNMHNAVGSNTDNVGSSTIVGQLKQTNQTLGTVRSTTASEDLFGKISTIRNYTENNNDKLVNIKKAIGEAGDVVSASTISGRLHSVAYVTGTITDSADDTTISGKLQAIKSTVGKVSDNSTGTTISARLAAIKSATTSNYSVVDNLRDHVGFPSDQPTDNTVIGLLKAIKENGGSGTGADMTTVNTKTTAINAAIGATSDESTANTVIGLLKRIIQNN